MAPIEILDPTVEPRQQPLTYVPRPDSLKGRRIGLPGRSNGRHRTPARWSSSWPGTRRWSRWSRSASFAASASCAMSTPGSS